MSLTERFSNQNKFERISVERQEDHLIQATAADATIRLSAVVSTNLVAEACRRHRTSPTTSAALGRALTGLALLGHTFKVIYLKRVMNDLQVV